MIRRRTLVRKNHLYYRRIRRIHQRRSQRPEASFSSCEQTSDRLSDNKGPCLQIDWVAPFHFQQKRLRKNLRPTLRPLVVLFPAPEIERRIEREPAPPPASAVRLQAAKTGTVSW